MKKVLSSFILALSMASATYAQETATIGDVKYLLDEGEATILEQPDDLAGDIVVPSTVTYNGTEYTVNRMMDNAFAGTKITSIILPNSLVKIGETAFSGCSQLKNVTLPEKMTSLGDDYFSNCKSIVSITLPSGITSIGEDCFYNCSSLTTIALPNKLEALGKNCFSCCSSLAEIELPNSIKSLGDYCFYYTGLVSITLPNSITEMGAACFCNCSKLTSVTLPTSLETLPISCFDGCTKLQSITIPNNYTELASYCFFECSSLSSVEMSNNLETIGGNCFNSCSSLSSIKLPSTIKKIGDSAFSGCALVAITLPSSITSIGSYCFSSCSSLIKVTCKWENLNYVEVEESAFYNIYSKAELYVPNGTIEQYKAVMPWSAFNYIYEKGGTNAPTEQCAMPTIGYADGKLTFSSSTEGAEYHYTITDDDILANGYSEDGSVALSAAYNIRAYASADGYQKSDVAEAKLCFVGGSIDATSIDAAKQRGVIIETCDKTVNVNGLTDGETVSLYSLSGVMLSSAKASAGTASLNVPTADNIVIVKIGGDSVKLTLKK